MSIAVACCVRTDVRGMTPLSGLGRGTASWPGVMASCCVGKVGFLSVELDLRLGTSISSDVNELRSQE